MDLPSLVNQSPLVELLDIEVTEATDGHATGRLTFGEDLLSHSSGEVAHGAATYALADTVGGSAAISLAGDVCPTVDMRIDYLAPARTDLTATADVLRHGANLSTVRVDIHDTDGTLVATAHGTYKTGGQGEDTPWFDESAVTEG